MQDLKRVLCPRNSLRDVTEVPLVELLKGVLKSFELSTKGKHGGASNMGQPVGRDQLLKSDMGSPHVEELEAATGGRSCVLEIKANNSWRVV